MESRTKPQIRPQIRKETRHVVSIIGLGLFCTTFGQPSVGGGYPIRYFLKDQLKLDASQVSTFFLIATLFWYLKPFAGILSDSLPLFGTRRKHYLAFSALAAFALWIGIGFVRYNYRAFLLGTILLNASLVIGSTVSGGLLVEEAQKIQATGRLSAMRQLLQNLATLIAGPAGIWAYDHLDFRGTAALIGAIFLPLALLTFLWLHEGRTAQFSRGALYRMKAELSLLAHTRLLWATAGMWALVVMAPGFGTLLVFRQTDVLHFPHEFVAKLAFVTGAGGILASILYGFLCRIVSLRVLLPLAIVMTAGGSLLYLNYNEHTALWIDGLNGALSVLTLLPLFDMAARATPKHAAALGYSLLMSVNNLIIQGSDKLGATLSVRFHWQFRDLILLNALTTLVSLIAVPFLPKPLLAGKDA